jgi:hypothetical protein
MSNNGHMPMHSFNKCIVCFRFLLILFCFVLYSTRSQIKISSKIQNKKSNDGIVIIGNWFRFSSFFFFSSYSMTWGTWLIHTKFWKRKKQKNKKQTCGILYCIHSRERWGGNEWNTKRGTDESKIVARRSVDKLSNHESNVPDNRNHRTKKENKKEKKSNEKWQEGSYIGVYTLLIKLSSTIYIYI